MHCDITFQRRLRLACREYSLEYRLYYINFSQYCAHHFSVLVQPKPTAHSDKAAYLHPGAQKTHDWAMEDWKVHEWTLTDEFTWVDTRTG